MDKVIELRDPLGTIRKAEKLLPDTRHKVRLVEALAELEDNECHRTTTFPKTQLHKLVGIKENVFRAYIVKATGWRLHVQYATDGTYILVNDVLDGREHDHATRLVKTRLHRYQTPR